MGRAFEIFHPEIVMVTKKGIVVIEDPAGYVDLLPALLITGFKGLEFRSSEQSSTSLPRLGRHRPLPAPFRPGFTPRRVEKSGATAGTPAARPA